VVGEGKVDALALAKCIRVLIGRWRGELSIEGSLLHSNVLIRDTQCHQSISLAL
jgi:hypothetical protein